MCDIAVTYISWLKSSVIKEYLKTLLLHTTYSLLIYIYICVYLVMTQKNLQRFWITKVPVQTISALNKNPIIQYMVGVF